MKGVFERDLARVSGGDGIAPPSCCCCSMADYDILDLVVGLNGETPLMRQVFNYICFSFGESTE